MGYYTYYSLEIKGIKNEDEFNDIQDYLKEKELLGYAFSPSKYYSGDDIQFLDTYEDCKWYEWDQDMQDIAKRFPDITFRLNGEGEEHGDVWQAYYHGDESEKCESEIPPPKTIEW